jgi:hypothetical protein
MNLANRTLVQPDYEVAGSDGNLKVTRTSLFTKQRNSMTLPITRDELQAYARGADLIQNVFPNLTPDQREFIQSGATLEEWNSMFGSDEDEEDPV